MIPTKPKVRHFNLPKLGKLPIPNISPEQHASIIELVDKILTAKRKGLEKKVSRLERKLDKEVAALYDIESSDRNVFGEIRRHTYFLTDDAEELWSDIENDPEFPKWKKELNRINAHETAHDFNKLSIAAKVHYIVSWRGKRTTEQARCGSMKIK